MTSFGIDVSEHNGTLDWGKIKAAGIDFAILRTGYGTTHIDNQWEQNIRGALGQGIPVGVYHFSYAISPLGAKKEGEFVCSILEPFRGKIFLPVFYDFEYDTVDYAARQGVTLGKQAFNDHAEAFCEAVAQGGYTPGVYYNLDYLRRFVDMTRLGKYVRWYAQYAAAPTVQDYGIWQYSSTHSIPGISGRFDANLLKDASLLENITKKYTPGWHQDSRGWWYADSETSYFRDAWAKIGGKWYYFDSEGYCMANAWHQDSTGTYYLGADGAMVTGQLVGLGQDGRLQPVEKYYHLISELGPYYRAEIDKLITAGKLKGKSGAGEELVLDLSESALRTMIVNARVSG